MEYEKVMLRLDRAVLYLCKRHGTRDALELARRDAGDYAAVRVLLALREIVGWVG